MQLWSVGNLYSDKIKEEKIAFTAVVVGRQSIL